jgi:hypothetical protein
VPIAPSERREEGEARAGGRVEVVSACRRPALARIECGAGTKAIVIRAIASESTCGHSSDSVKWANKKVSGSLFRFGSSQQNASFVAMESAMARQTSAISDNRNQDLYSVLRFDPIFDLLLSLCCKSAANHSLPPSAEHFAALCAINLRRDI